MLSTGNDIVSLGHINTLRTKEMKFYNKILTPSELRLYNTEVLTEISFEIFVWLAWSIKESAFKYLNRSMPDLIFSPLKINIQSLTLPRIAAKNFGSPQYETTSFNEEFACHGIVRCGLAFFHSRSVIYHELIHTVVNKDESFGNIWWGIKTIACSDDQNQSSEVRSFLLKKLQAVLPGRKLTIDKTVAGCPVILNEAKEVDLPVSIAHHHHFIAYSFLLSGSDKV
jgi:phosphopantetheinyl transferase (holo-ACP synthase)